VFRSSRLAIALGNYIIKDCRTAGEFIPMKNLTFGSLWRAMMLAVMAALAAATVAAQAPPGAPMSPGAAEATPPLIDAVSYSGNHKISTAVLTKDSSIEAGVPISRALVGNEIKRVIALYRQAGLDLSISPNIQHPAAGHVTVEFQIDENGKGGDSGAAPAGTPPGAGPPPGGGPPRQ
jgi:hypothetical protein